MNILFFLTPKEEVAYIQETDTLRQAMEKMEHRGYTAIPMLTEDGKYVGTVTEGDILWQLKRQGFPSLDTLEHSSVSEVKRRREVRAVSVSASMESLLERVLEQNYVPVIDDKQIFIGIVTRRDVIRHLQGQTV